MAETIRVRPAELRDMERVFELSNDPLVRVHSIHKEPIAWETHVAWFVRTLANVNRKFFVAETTDGGFVGQVRFDREDGAWLVSISVVGEFRGKGLAGDMLRASMGRVASGRFVAEIAPDNAASRRLFVSAGFVENPALVRTPGYLVFQRGWKMSMERVFVIAEMSANHCGDIDLAKRIIAAAKECGVDAVKLQTYTADTLTIDCKNEHFRIGNGSLWDGRYFYDLYKEAYTPWEWQRELKEYGESIGIDVFSTPFDKTATDFLDGMGVKWFKVASFEAIDLPLIRYVASKRKPMIVSTGICSLSEMQDIVDACKAEGNDDITLLKCTSAYPARPEDMNLLTLSDMAGRFGPQGVKIGLSDHSMSIETVVAGVALGARVVEKHFTLDRALGGADAPFSLNPVEMKATVAAVRKTEQLLGHVDYSVNQNNRQFARSLFVTEDIKKGELFTERNVRSIRPGVGCLPKHLPEVLGAKAAQDVPRGTPFDLKFVTR